MGSASVPPTDQGPGRALRSRLLTAAVLGGALVLLVAAGSPGLLAAVLAVFLALAAWEWGALCGWSRIVLCGWVLATLAVAMLLWGALAPGAARLALLLATVAGWAAAGAAVAGAERGRAVLPEQGLVLALLGWGVLLPLWLSLLWLKTASPLLLLALFALIWLADSAAYFFGRRYGRRRLAPRVSPGKTWAGVGGALLAAPTVALVFGLAAGYRGAALAGFGMLCLVTVVASIIGDLFESLLKRRAGVKDSGTLLPGHGGVLDRIDSLTAAAPVFCLGLSLLGSTT
ncbi:MAG TPA: phosphatidate cytidylyltransferase [Gammaproteobacteria bacterium]|nr:phosphatidate cytidylyltransferase [Gammaproteobacteria bacterium]